VHYLRKALLAVLLLAALLLTACGSSDTKSTDPIKSAGVLRVGTEGVYAPYSFHDPSQGGQLAGYDVDVAKAVADKLGVRIEFVETSWDSIFAALEADRFDIVANEVTITDDRKAKYDLSTPYSIAQGVIVTRSDDNSIHSLADLKGKRAAESPTSNWAQTAREAGAQIESVDGFTQAISVLNDGRVDVVINDSITVLAYQAQHPEAKIKVAATIDEHPEQAFAARKDSGLLPELNKALDELRADGTLTKISDKYLDVDLSKGPPKSAWQLILENLWPLAKAALLVTIPLTIISFAIGLVIALVVALGRLSSNAVIAGVAGY
jgi:ABC-type amino acid transport substrate-binding protein